LKAIYVLWNNGPTCKTEDSNIIQKQNRIRIGGRRYKTMNMPFWSMAALFVVFPLKANAQSIQPFYAPQDVIFKPELVGSWNSDEGVTFEFRDVGEKTYGISVPVDDGFAYHFRAHLIYLRGKYFLDAQISGIQFPEKVNEAQDHKEEKGKDSRNDDFRLDDHDVFWNRHHGLVLIEFTSADEFVGHVWEEAWLPRMAKQRKLKCPYLKDEMGRILLTGDRAQLRAFVSQLPPEAFESGSKLTRIKGDQAEVAPPNVPPGNLKLRRFINTLSARTYIDRRSAFSRFGWPEHELSSPASSFGGGQIGGFHHAELANRQEKPQRASGVFRPALGPHEGTSIRPCGRRRERVFCDQSRKS
jgi:hypothetical protein